MNHYQVNLRSIANTAPRTPFEALMEEGGAPGPAPVSPLRCLHDHLEMLLDLGIELLHVMPPFRMGLLERKGIGSPYAVADYSEIDPEFGTREEWFDLVRKAHRLGMKLIVGFMPNHVARDHVWIEEDPRHTLRDEKGSPAYDFDWSDTAKLDYSYPPLRRKVIDTLLYWLRGEDPESGVDGYRMDMAHMLNDLSFWDECIPELEAAAGERPLLMMAECYGFERNLDLFSRGFHAAYDDDFYKIAQYGYARDKAGHSRLLLDEAAAHNQDFAPRLEAWKNGGIAAAVISLIRDCAERAPDRLQARYVDNHDEGRGVYRFGEQACRVLMDLAACMPRSILFTLAGQEAGALNRPPIHEYIAVCDKGYRRLDGDQVTEVPGIEFEGNLFLRTAEKRREAISEARKRFQLRQQHPVLTEGDWMPLDVEEDALPPERAVVAFTRRDERETLHCLFNLSHQPRRIKHVPAGTRLLGIDPAETLPPFSTCVLRQSN